MSTRREHQRPASVAPIIPDPDPNQEPAPIIPDPNPNPDPAPIIPDPNPNPEPAPIIPGPETVPEMRSARRRRRYCPQPSRR